MLTESDAGGRHDKRGGGKLISVAFLLAPPAMRCFGPPSPLCRRIPRVHRRFVLSGICPVNVSQIFAALAGEPGRPGYYRDRQALWGRQHAAKGAPQGSQASQKRARTRCLGRARSGLTCNLQGAGDGHSRLVVTMHSAEEMNDQKGDTIPATIVNCDSNNEC